MQDGTSIFKLPAETRRELSLLKEMLPDSAFAGMPRSKSGRQRTNEMLVRFLIDSNPVAADASRRIRGEVSGE
jgi:hypothetical protein